VGIPGDVCVGVIVPEMIQAKPSGATDIDTEIDDVLRNIAVRVWAEFIRREYDGFVPTFVPSRLQ